MTGRIIAAAFAVAYLLALAIYFIGTYGLFGQNPDPLSGVFLIPLGLPWSLMEVPESRAAALAIAAPLINLLILLVIIWMISKRSG
ncbi:MAG: hypothetical protein NXI13_00685 [Proteobacteria bacterium]|nr:hypothetical protein [Pseudomonadota bacterium]